MEEVVPISSLSTVVFCHGFVRWQSLPGVIFDFCSNHSESNVTVDKQTYVFKDGHFSR